MAPVLSDEDLAWAHGPRHLPIGSAGPLEQVSSLEPIIKIRWLVQITYTRPGERAGERIGCMRWIGRHPDGLPFENQRSAELQAQQERDRHRAPDAELTATVIPVTPPDPLEVTDG